MTRALPAASFAEISIDLALFANREAQSLPALELFVAQGGNVKSLKAVLAQTKRAAETGALLSELFRVLQPIEAELRDVLEVAATEVALERVPDCDAPQGPGVLMLEPELAKRRVAVLVAGIRASRAQRVAAA